MSHDTHAKPEAFDELDPHHSGVHASHVIVGPMQLRTILAVLLFFTALTVGFARAEMWASEYFDVVMPHWVNLVGAMSIATIKALLVMAIFMQLKYDNPINTLIMGLTFAALAVFISFTGMDLFGRAEVYDWKAPQVVSGGTGGRLWQVEGSDRNLATPVGESIAVYARNQYLKGLREKIKAANPNLDDAALEVAVLAQFEHDREATIGHGHHGAAHASDTNTASRSRPRHGLSGALDTTPAKPAPDAHAAPAGGH